MTVVCVAVLYKYFKEEWRLKRGAVMLQTAETNGAGCCCKFQVLIIYTLLLSAAENLPFLMHLWALIALRAISQYCSQDCLCMYAWAAHAESAFELNFLIRTLEGWKASDYGKWFRGGKKGITLLAKSQIYNNQKHWIFQSNPHSICGVSVSTLWNAKFVLACWRPGWSELRSYDVILLVITSVSVKMLCAICLVIPQNSSQQKHGISELQTELLHGAQKGQAGEKMSSLKKKKKSSSNS